MTIATGEENVKIEERFEILYQPHILQKIASIFTY